MKVKISVNEIRGRKGERERDGAKGVIWSKKIKKLPFKNLSLSYLAC